MTQKQFWMVEQVHVSGAYNDSDKYEIRNGLRNPIVSYDDKKLLDLVCLEHNKCFLEETV